jgi:hypothetical protein
MRWRSLRNQPQAAHPRRSCLPGRWFRSFEKKLKLPRACGIGGHGARIDRSPRASRVSAERALIILKVRVGRRSFRLPNCTCRLNASAARAPRLHAHKSGADIPCSSIRRQLGRKLQHLRDCVTHQRSTVQNHTAPSDAVPHLGRAQHKQHVLSSIRTGAGAAASRRCPPPQGRVKSPCRSCRRPRFQRG